MVKFWKKSRCIDKHNTRNLKAVSSTISYDDIFKNSNIYEIFDYQDAQQEFKLPELPDEYCLVHVKGLRVICCEIISDNSVFEYPKCEKAKMVIRFDSQKDLDRFLYMISKKYEHEEERNFIQKWALWEKEEKLSEIYKKLLSEYMKSISGTDEWVNMEYLTNLTATKLRYTMFFFYNRMKYLSLEDLFTFIKPFSERNEQQQIFVENLQESMNIFSISNICPVIDILFKHAKPLPTVKMYEDTFFTQIQELVCQFILAHS